MVISFNENISNFKTGLWARGYSHSLRKITSEVKFTEQKSALKQTAKVRKKILPFVTTYHPAWQPNFKNILISKWHLTENQPLLREIFKEPPFISYKKEIFK